MASYQYTFTFGLVGLIICIFVVVGLLVWAWGTFLDKYEHDPGHIRAVMFLILTAVTATELGFAADGFVHPWVAGVSVTANVWGAFDAVLRYPAAHDFESFFTTKQFLLLIVKTLAVAFGAISIKTNIVKFMLQLVLNTWGLPVLYLMALPLDPAEQVIKDDKYDVDIAVRFWQLAFCSQERRCCLASCKLWWRRQLAAASECSKLACFVICAASPEFRRTYKASGRRV